MLQEIRLDFSERDAQRQWAILRDWIREFLGDKYCSGNANNLAFLLNTRALELAE